MTEVMRDHSCSWMIWSIVVILALALGLYAGYRVMKAISDLQAQLEAAQASLAEANIELAFWQTTIRGLAEGRQLEGIELNGRPSLGD